MRICGGLWKGRKLLVPTGDSVRPTTERVREALFQMLNLDLAGLHLLDIYAGTGVLGLEGLSRGADSCTFVERHKCSQDAIRHNIQVCQARQRTTLIRTDATRPGTYARLPAANAPIGLVLMDPPYGQGLVDRTLATLETLIPWGAETHVAAEHEPGSLPRPPGPHWVLATRRHYGESALSLWIRRQT